ncbi:MAG TPA: symmetrical bis(5'-nucleosyl)-tetraphosphatase [Methylophilaceae bacterium]|nr:symmetrical bis(5'-nucleosyl)-tetraphosphatase [Methylophilaceae bacterium]HQR60423.1 symmetrical bis(5'-nucleosyl)-tetraphosphatase [Methylophilaceae bacterium]
MATYAVGDIQGCYTSFTHLLQHIGFSPVRDRLWLVGDIINRGPDSLAVLRWAMQHQDSLEVVLGNHDLHALALAEGFVEAHRYDTVQALFEAPDREELLTWLRGRRMAHAEGEYLMVHAGVLPQWDASLTLTLAAEVETVLRSDDYRYFLSHMYGNHPNRWDGELRGMSRLRVITNALTRLRVCTLTGDMDFRFKGELSNIPAGYLPWFELENRNSSGSTLLFGHWSALGLLVRDNLIGLDTGCLWGGQLSAMRLEDRRVFQVPCAAEDAIKKIWRA